jgi:GGDEF domain-containing protein
MSPASPPATGLRKRRIRPRWTAVGMASTLSRHPLFAGVAGTVVAVLMASLSIVTLYQGRQGALEHARETSANLVAIISTDIARNVEIYDLSLKAMVEGAQNPALTGLSPTLRRQILFDRATSAAYISGAYVLDVHAHGTVTVSIGCATASPPGLGGAYGLLGAADQQLYKAKAAGRDCVRPLAHVAAPVARS